LRRGQQRAIRSAAIPPGEGARNPAAATTTEGLFATGREVRKFIVTKRLLQGRIVTKQRGNVTREREAFGLFQSERILRNIVNYVVPSPNPFGS
jgi:hypothetical protein